MMWTPEVAASHPEVEALIDGFESRPSSAGKAAADWLRDDSLNNHPSTVTWLFIKDEKIQAFYALCSSQIKLSQSQRKRLLRRTKGLHPRKQIHELHPIQPVALIAWLAKSPSSEITGGDLLLQATATALEVMEVSGQGQVALTLDPFDEETAEFWQENYGFRRSQDLDGHYSLWRTILDDPDQTETST